MKKLGCVSQPVWGEGTNVGQRHAVEERQR